MDYIVREIAKSMDLDPDKVANSMSQAAVQAEILKKFQAQNPPPAPPQGMMPQQQGQPPAPPGGQVEDTQGSGGGTIGTGSVPTPQEPGFTGDQGPIQ
jgi:hypothetical protein